MSTPDDAIHVLHVDDDSSFLETTAHLLGREDDRFRVRTATDVDAGLGLLERETVHCVVSDHDMPGRDGLEFLRAVRERDSELPFVLFTGKGSEEIASEAISAGVTEYIQKGGPEQYPVLANRIENAVARYRSEQQNRRLRAFTEHASDLVSVVDEHGRIRYESPSVREMLGYEPDELVGEYAFEYIHPDDHEEVMSEFFAAIEDPSYRPDVVYRFRHADGDWRVLESRGVNRRDDPVVDGVIINSRDVTERERLAAEYERTVARMTDGFFSIDSNWRFTYLNEVGREVVCAAAGEDQPVDDLLGTDIWSFIPEATDTVFYEEYTRAMHTQEPTTFEAEYPPLDSWFSVRVYPSDSGLSIYFQDVTELRERARVAETERKRFRVLFENLPEAGVFAEVVDGQPVVRRVNPAFAEVFGYDAETAVDHPVNDLIVPEDCRDEARFLDERAVAGSVETREVERVTVSGARRAFRYYGVPLPDAPDGVTRGFAIYTDVTDQRRRAAALERQNERLENLINFVSHDLRNPLGIAQGNLDIARAGGSLNRLDEVDAALDRMDTLIDGLLTLARESTDVTEREHYRLSTIVEGAWRTVETGAATYTVESDGTLLADGGRLRRALENLFRNSVEHGSTGHRASPDDSVEHSSTGSPSEGGGGPDVETASTDGGRPLTVRVGVLPDESGFFVEDDGSGIPEDRREAVFESGYTTNDGGTGFGLAIVHEVVKAHGWSVSVTDGEAGGARFEVTGVEFA